MTSRTKRAKWWQLMIVFRSPSITIMYYFILFYKPLLKYKKIITLFLSYFILPIGIKNIRFINYKERKRTNCLGVGPKEHTPLTRVHDTHQQQQTTWFFQPTRCKTHLINCYLEGTNTIVIYYFETKSKP